MKKCRLLIATMMISASASIMAIAGEWKSNENGWWYDRGDGSWPVNGWEWIDGNSDGIAECYYFNSDGYCLLNTATPDNYIVDANGAWIVNGLVQTQPVTINGNEAGAVQPVSYVGVYALADYWPKYIEWPDEYMPLGLGYPAIRIDSHLNGIIQGHYYDGSTGASLDMTCDFMELVDNNGHFSTVLPEQGYEVVLDFYLQESQGKKIIMLNKTVVKHANFELEADDFAKQELKDDYYSGIQQFIEYH